MYRTEDVRVVDLEPGMKTALVGSNGVHPYGEILSTRRVDGGIEIEIRYSSNDTVRIVEDDERLANDSTFTIAVPVLS